jgi:hypothetical protein
MRTNKVSPAARPKRGPVNQRTVGGEGVRGRSGSARQVEQVGILALALVFGLIGFAVHAFGLAAIVLMAVLLGLIASGLRGRRGGGVISEVATAVSAEAKNLAEDIASVGARAVAGPKLTPLLSLNHPAHARRQ